MGDERSVATTKAIIHLRILLLLLEPARSRRSSLYQPVARKEACELLQLAVFRPSFIEDGNVGISILPQGKEILIRSFGFRRIPRHGVGTAQAQLGERMLNGCRGDATMIHDLLKFRRRLVPT